MRTTRFHGPVLSGHISFGPATQPSGGLPARLQLGDPRTGGQVQLCLAQSDCVIDPSSPVGALRGRVHLTFASGSIPALPGPIPIWEDGVIGQVWGLRPI